ncbi:MAG TPA: hypothetical protein VHT27_00660 [Solirubrobacteraceae bacterium]|jgi:hypothetical protein|nr:hypothetical protein [Solirubrobacteraceae bacterium]
MTSVRRFQLDELILRPGTYFNPQTEIMILVDDSPEVDHEIFESEELEASEWVLISEDVPLDENERDDLVERFQRSHQEGATLLDEAEEEDEDEDDEDPDEDEDEEDELDGVDELDLGRD